MTRKKTRIQTQQNREKRRKLMIGIMFGIILLGIIFVVKCSFGGIDIDNIDYPGWIQQDIIGKDGHSRTGKPLKRVKDIVIHYVANPGSTAKQNRDFFNSSSSTVSAHFIVGLKGEVVQCVPLNEQSSASNQRNVDTISIEVCHPNKTGKFNTKTYGALVQLSAWLCGQFRLDGDDLIRHYDITGKICPKYYVDHPDAWEQLCRDVDRRM